MTLKINSPEQLVQLISSDTWNVDYSDSQDRVEIVHSPSGQSYILKSDGTLVSSSIELVESITDASGTEHTGEIADVDDLHDRYEDQEAISAVASSLVSGSNISIDYSSHDNSITIDTESLDQEQVQDSISSLLQTDENLDLAYDDANNQLTILMSDSIFAEEINGADISQASGQQFLSATDQGSQLRFRNVYLNTVQDTDALSPVNNPDMLYVESIDKYVSAYKTP